MQPLDPLQLPLRGCLLLEASAGTGKTYTLALLVLRLLLEQGLAVDQILVVTFTRAATGELRDRIRRRIREALDVLNALDAQDHGGSDDPRCRGCWSGWKRNPPGSGWLTPWCAWMRPPSTPSTVFVSGCCRSTPLPRPPLSPWS